VKKIKWLLISDVLFDDTQTSRAEVIRPFITVEQDGISEVEKEKIKETLPNFFDGLYQELEKVKKGKEEFEQAKLKEFDSSNSLYQGISITETEYGLLFFERHFKEFVEKEILKGHSPHDKKKIIEFLKTYLDVEIGTKDEIKKKIEELKKIKELEAFIDQLEPLFKDEADNSNELIKLREPEFRNPIKDFLSIPGVKHSDYREFIIKKCLWTL
jgi:hypothetical protein